MPSNRYADQCALPSCGKHIPAGSGILGPKNGRRWPVYCTAEELKHAQALPAQRTEMDPDASLPPAEVRINGTSEQCTAIADAIRYTAFMTVVQQSQPWERRDADDGRMTVYTDVAVDALLLQGEATRKEARR